MLALPQELLPGLKTVTQKNNDLKLSSLLWLHCHLVLLTGSRPGQIITVSAFLLQVKRWALACL